MSTFETKTKQSAIYDNTITQGVSTWSFIKQVTQLAHYDQSLFDQQLVNYLEDNVTWQMNRGLNVSPGDLDNSGEEMSPCFRLCFNTRDLWGLGNSTNPTESLSDDLYQKLHANLARIIVDTFEKNRLQHSCNPALLIELSSRSESNPSHFWEGLISELKKACADSKDRVHSRTFRNAHFDYRNYLPGHIYIDNQSD